MPYLYVPSPHFRPFLDQYFISFNMSAGSSLDMVDVDIFHSSFIIVTRIASFNNFSNVGKLNGIGKNSHYFAIDESTVKDAENAK
jgi:hypothetical protein